MRQSLQPYAQAGGVVTGRTGEVERPRAPEEQRLAERDRILFLGLIELGGEFHAAGFAGDVSGHGAQLLDRLPAAGMRPLDEIGGVEALQLLHAPQDARLEVHDAVGIGEIARQLGEGAVDLSRHPCRGRTARAMMFFGPRGVVHNASPRSASSNPGLLHGIFLEHLAIFFDRLFGRAILRDRHGGSGDGRTGGREQHASDGHRIVPPRFVAFVLLLAQVSNSPRGEARTATLTRRQYMHFFE